DLRNESQRCKGSRSRNQTDRSASKESDSGEARPLAQTHRLANTFHDLLRDFVRASRAFFENAINVRFVGQNFFAALAHWCKIFPKFLEKLFLEIAIAGSAFQKLLAHSRDFILGCDKRVKFED